MAKASDQFERVGNFEHAHMLVRSVYHSRVQTTRAAFTSTLVLTLRSQMSNIFKVHAAWHVDTSTM